MCQSNERGSWRQCAIYTILYIDENYYRLEFGQISVLREWTQYWQKKANRSQIVYACLGFVRIICRCTKIEYANTWIGITGIWIVYSKNTITSIFVYEILIVFVNDWFSRFILNDANWIAIKVIWLSILFKAAMLLSIVDRMTKETEEWISCPS